MSDFSELLGPLAPFLAIIVVGFLLAAAAILLTRQTVGREKIMGMSETGQTITWFFLCIGNFLLWGSVAGGRIATPDGGIVGYVDGGVFSYVTITSSQLSEDANWTHELAINSTAVLMTAVLSVLLLTIVYFIFRGRQLIFQNRKPI